MRLWYLAGDVRGHGWRGFGVDVGILRDEARVVGGDTAEAVGTSWRRMCQAAVATGRTGWVSLRASRWTRGTTVGAVHTAAGWGRHSRHKGHRRVGVEGMEVGIRMVWALMNHAVDFKKVWMAKMMVQKHEKIRMDIWR